VGKDQRSMVSSRRQDEDDMDTSPIVRGRYRRSFFGPFPDDRLEDSNLGLDLHQHNIAAAIEADVC
jgi:hypothetical protein